jgi:hypothetical protein
MTNCRGCAVLEASLIVERERVDRLTQEMLTMKREGFAPPPQMGERTEEKPLPGKIALALEQRAKPGTQRYGMILADVRRRIALGEAESDIATRILEGDD